ncbi:hypothetical protein M3Y98_00028100 [Aphelenchoides besseyi]|nr:hypothetical protein M3Y98_00028100 [Aphelenchoides besseyi]
MQLMITLFFVFLVVKMNIAAPSRSQPAILSASKDETIATMKTNDLGGTTTTTKSPQTLKSETNSTKFVPLNQWHCGSNDFDKWLAHSFIETDCPTRMVETNDCCLAHDICYTQALPRQQCDFAFCQCLDNALSNSRQCRQHSKTFCGVVEEFGEVAHKNSQGYVLTSTTPVPTTTPSVDETEKKIFKQIVDTKLNSKCYNTPNENTSSCMSQFDLCSNDNHICAYDFCGCVRQDLFIGQNGETDCWNNFQLICGFYRPGEVISIHSNITWWTEKYLGLTLLQAMFVGICLVVALISFVFWTVRYIRNGRDYTIEKRPVAFVNEANSSASSSTSSFYAYRTSMNSVPLLSGVEFVNIELTRRHQNLFHETYEYADNPMCYHEYKREPYFIEHGTYHFAVLMHDVNLTAEIFDQSNRMVLKCV